jgi:hypothetical protein
MDIMGTGNYMYQNISLAAQKILNFQILAKKYESDNVTIYPMMDGVYIVSEDVDVLINFIDIILENAAKQVLKENLKDAFVIRGGISFGPVVEGKDFSVDLDEEYSQNIESLLIGPPMVEAYRSEEKAPPFGIAVHDSARAFSSDAFQYQWYKWFHPKNRELANDLRKKLEKYFEHSIKVSHITNYPEEKIADHREMMERYLPEVKLKNKE